MKGTPIKYSPAELDFLSANRTLTRLELTKAFNAQFGRDVAVEHIKALCTRRKWNSGRDGRFQKGNIPHSKAHPNGPNATSFKKGNRPHTWLPVGTEVIDDEGYIKVKTADPSTWFYKHRLIWEKQHGPIAPGSLIRFIDNNPLNCVLSNLESVTMAENLRLNHYGYARLPAELKPAMKAVAALEVKAFDLSRQN